MAKVKITETVLRDAHQSLIATRMPSSEMEPILDTMDQIGYNAVECWRMAESIATTLLQATKNNLDLKEVFS